MSAARAARDATSCSWARVLGSWVPKIFVSFTVGSQAGAGGACPRACPSHAELVVLFQCGVGLPFRLYEALEPASDRPLLHAALRHRFNVLRPHAHAGAGDVHERDPLG